MEFLFFIFPLLLIFGTHALVVSPVLKGKRQIDPQLFPTLTRAVKVIRSNNVEARKKEHHAAIDRIYSESSLEMTERENKFKSEFAQKQLAHNKEASEWDKQLWVLDAPERQRQAKELEAQYAEQARRSAEALRLRNIQWAEEERIRKENDDKAARELEKHYESLQDVSWRPLVKAGGLRAPVNTRYDLEEEYGYTSRKVMVHSVYVRSEPSKKGRIVNNLTQYERINVDAWATGEELYGNPIWFHIKPGGPRLAGWIWSGALHNTSTTGLPQAIPEEEETVTIRSCDGLINQTIVTGGGYTLTSQGATFDRITPGALTADKLFVQAPVLRNEKMLG